MKYPNEEIIPLILAELLLFILLGYCIYCIIDLINKNDRRNN